MKFCDSRLMRCHVKYGACFSADQLIAGMQKIGIDDDGSDFPKTEFAMTITARHPKSGKPVVFVCLNMQKNRREKDAIATMIHEAVHVWQENRQYIAEEKPAAEQEAYCIEQIAINLIAQYWAEVGVLNVRRRVTA